MHGINISKKQTTNNSMKNSGKEHGVMTSQWSKSCRVNKAGGLNYLNFRDENESIENRRKIRKLADFVKIVKMG